MPNTLKVQNFFFTNVTSESIPSSGAFTFNVATAPSYQNGFLVISAENTLQREIVYFHEVSGNTVSVRAENRGLGGTSAKEHTQGETITMRDVAEIFNFYADAVSTCFFVEKTGGLNVKVWGGTVYYNAAPQEVSDTNLVLTDNTTNYIKYDFATNTISTSTVNSGNVKAIVVVLSGLIVSIAYKTAKETFIDYTVTINDALPSQTSNSGKSLITDGTNANWGIPSANGILPSQTGNAGKGLLTDGNNISWQELIAPGTFMYGDSSDGDVVISTNTTLTRDMYYNNLTINSGIILSPDGYRIFVNGTLTNNGEIRRNGNNGGNASGSTAGVGATTLNSGTLGSIVGGFTGGAGIASFGTGLLGATPTSTNPSYVNITGANGGAGGAAINPSPGVTAGGTSTRGVLYNTFFDIGKVISNYMFPANTIAVQYQGSPGSGGGSSGSANGVPISTGGGGGSGGPGGIIFIVARILAGTGIISVLGGTGGTGGNASGSVQGGGGGGGAGGCGGVVIIMHDSGTVYTINLTGGSPGAGGSGIGGGSAGTSGSTGTTGQSIIINV